MIRKAAQTSLTRLYKTQGNVLPCYYFSRRNKENPKPKKDDSNPQIKVDNLQPDNKRRGISPHYLKQQALNRMKFMVKWIFRKNLINNIQAWKTIKFFKLNFGYQDDKNKTDSDADKGDLKNNKYAMYFSWFISTVGFYWFYNSAKDVVALSRIEELLQQIQHNPEQPLVKVSRIGPNQILLKLNNLVVNLPSEAALVAFLDKLQTIRNGETIVEFSPNHQQLPVERSQYITTFIFYGIIFGGMFYIFRKLNAANNLNGLGSMLNNKKFEPINPENIKIKFQHVAGMHEAKFQITQFVDFLKKPDKYIEMGAKVPKGALLTGPPGTGKTLLAKACAGEAGVPFFSVSGSDFIQKFSGLGASRVRNLFDEAEKVAPSIIFIDEIDAIGKKRDSGPFANEEKDNTLNQLLVRMDGFDTKNKVIVMAATNRKDMLDPALLRPGRFDRSVQIGLPNQQERAEILKVHLKKVVYDKNIKEDELAIKLARITPGFSGAELANTCNQAAILGARQKAEFITFQQFQKATQRVLAGLEKRNVFSQDEKQSLSFYEAGKAVGNWFTEGADPVIKISILPFTKSKSGYSHSIKDETSLHTKEQLLDKICCYLAGRCSQTHFRGFVTSNGSKDLERAKRIATMIVTKFGMSDALKMYAFPDFDFIRKPYSEKSEAVIDVEISKIMKQCQTKVQKLIKEREPMILKLKEQILQKQTLNHLQIKQVLGERPFGNDNYNNYLKDQNPENSPKPNNESGVTTAKQ